MQKAIRRLHASHKLATPHDTIRRLHNNLVQEQQTAEAAATLYVHRLAMLLRYAATGAHE